MIDRRSLVLGLGLAGCTTMSKTPPPTPSAGQLQDGDFLWPRDPKAWIPYLQNEFKSASSGAEAAAFEEGKRDFLARQTAAAPWFTAADRARIERMTYDDFRRAYDLPGQVPKGVRSLGRFSVGHVAIVSLQGNEAPSVVEAVWGNVKKVRRKDYAQWIADHDGDWVFHGRLKGRSASERSLVRVEAEKHIGKPYDFWNFDLESDAGFYCSKLAWLAVHRALHFAIDGNDNPKRPLWFSPKQMFNCPTVEHLNGDCCYIA